MCVGVHVGSPCIHRGAHRRLYAHIGVCVGGLHTCRGVCKGSMHM